MTDERTPEGARTPSTDPPPFAPSWDTPTTATPPPPLASYVPPPIAPPAPQPAVAWETPAPASVGPGGRTTLAAAAGILMLVFGALGLLFGLLFVGVAGMVGGLSGSGAFGDIPGMPAGMEGAIGGFVAVIGVIIILFSLLYLIGGIGVLRSRGWGRVIGIVVGIIGGLIWLSGIFGSNATDTGVDTSGGVLFSLVLFVIHLFIVVVLAIRWRSKVAGA